MIPDREFVVRPAPWRDWAAQLRAIRDAVFVEEQGVPPEIEHDGRDRELLHVVALAGDRAIGTARLISDEGRAGRFAVLREWRGGGVGAALLAAVEGLARERGCAILDLDAQTAVAGFYARHGYRVRGEPFLKAGIEHVAMRKDLDRQPNRY